MSLLRLAVSYTLRSLRRGGQRTILALFCVAVGVMAIVALRLAGDMVRTSLTTNVRDIIGGDISVQSTGLPLTADQLGAVDRLKRGGRIDDYIAIGTDRGALRNASGHQAQVQIYIVDDVSRFPLVGGDEVTDPQGAHVGEVLTRPGTMLMSPFAAEQIAAHPGDRLHLGLTRGGGGDITLGGVLPNRLLTGNPAYIYISRADYAAISTNPTPRYGLVEILQPNSRIAATVADQLRIDYPSATVQTVQDALDQNLTASQQVDQYLQVVGLLALLIGGIGIVNTMQVSLRRRRVEVAMLKTAGYRRRELYALFGLEAGLLGLGGGIIGGVAGIGVSALVRLFIVRAFPIDVSFAVNGGDVLSGVAIGLATALIFGLIPIVRAAAIRPATVLRDDPTASTPGSVAQTVGLYLVLVALFTALAATLLGSVLVAVLVVVLSIVALALLGAVFGLIVLGVGLIPVVERVSLPWALVSLVAVALAAASAVWLGAVGAVLCVLVGIAVVMVGLPRRVKTATKLALRSLRRARLRTTTTLVALFTGIFGIGLILVLGSDISTKVNDALSTLSGFSVFASAGPQDAALLQSTTQTLPGVQDRRVTADIGTVPVLIDGRPIERPASVPGQPPQAEEDSQLRLSGAAGVEGFSLGGGDVPDPTVVIDGRALTSGDAGTTNVLARADLERSPVSLHVGSTITLEQPTSHRRVTVHIAGFYTNARLSGGGLRVRIFVQPLLGDTTTVDSLAGDPATNPDRETTVALQFDPAQKDAAVRTLEAAVPRAYILDVADIGDTVRHVISNLVVLLLALASLSVLAGIVIIANTTALAMLERRREVGILKAVGHSSGSVLAQVLVENALVAAIGAVAGMIVVTMVTGLLASQVFNTTLPVSAGVVLACVGGMVALVTATATLVAWGPTRIRPVEVLRYE